MDIRLDEGFLFGMGVFETVAVEQGRPLLLEQHLNRMQGSAEFFENWVPVQNVDLQKKKSQNI